MLKHCKSETDVGNDYYPVTTPNEPERAGKHLFKENQRRYNPLLNN
jgi:hypothetical protein